MEQMLANQDHFNTATRELFGPFQVIVEWKEGQIDDVLEVIDRMPNHLTAGIVSNDVQFVHHCLANTINGTQYAGIRAKTTAAPQQHWFVRFVCSRVVYINTGCTASLTEHRQILMFQMCFA